MIEIKGISKRYDRRLYVLKGVNATLKERVTSVIGPPAIAKAIRVPCVKIVTINSRVRGSDRDANRYEGPLLIT